MKKKIKVLLHFGNVARVFGFSFFFIKLDTWNGKEKYFSKFLFSYFIMVWKVLELEILNLMLYYSWENI